MKSQFLSSSTPRRFASSALAGFTLLLVACSSGESTETLVASVLGIVSGNGQSVVTGGSLTNPLVAEVLDQNAEAMQGVNVSWVIVSGGGSLSAASSATDASGNAQTRYTAGPVAGAASVRASVSGIPNPVVFNITITPGGASNRQQ